jgi:hypothetical protein
MVLVGEGDVLVFAAVHELGLTLGIASIQSARRIRQSGSQ